MFQRVRIVFATVAAFVLVAAVVYAQDVTGAPAPVTPQAAAAAAGAASLGPWAWLIDLGAPGVLLGVLLKLWSHFQKKDTEHQKEKAGWIKATTKLKASQVEATTKLKDKHENEIERIWGEARKDKTEMRDTFEAEKSARYATYSKKLDELQAKLEIEQKDRREEAERLLREQNTLVREVMETAQAMATSLQENTRAVDKFTEAMQ